MVGGLFGFCITRELGAEALGALGAAGGAFMAILMGFAAYFTATGAVKLPDPPPATDGTTKASEG
ncbi:hypothetical protein [Nonomuraea aridisoli]|uniref:Uncharacterized protein n=1 Tax=Nonomuraea aridisoli TaxID=2070368 RepID=A0A2W2CY83_9ACTN|nr:hypothetical protein [Nonomuraea aridisoli]PZG03433.1 hypothetical protein C1J01_45965 [Nonomuraea aridisoli]